MELMLYPCNIKLKRIGFFKSFFEKVYEFVREMCGRIKFLFLHRNVFVGMLLMIFHF